MSLQPGRALGLDPPERIRLRRPHDILAWARTIPEFGWLTEVYALFLDGRRRLLRAAWLGPSTTLDDFAHWPDFALGYAPPEAEAVVLLACRPGEGTDPRPEDRDTRELVGLAHAAADVPLLDVVLVDGLRWRSLSGGAC